MFFGDSFIKEVEDDPISGVSKVCKMTFLKLNELQTDSEIWNEDEHELLLESASFIYAVISEEDLKLSAKFPEVTGDIQENCKNLMVYVQTVANKFGEASVSLKVESHISRYKTVLKSSFAYEFSQGDLERIQILINELRSQISENELLEKNHKERLLKRLEKLQSELHKRVSDLDRFWGLVGDAGVILGKLGEDAKPIVDRTRELAEIVWKTQARAEELQSGIQNPMMEHEGNNG